MKRVPGTRNHYDNAPLSALLFLTRGTYTAAVRRAQDGVGCADVPPATEVLLNAMEWSGGSLEPVIRFLGISKQAVSQMVDKLVERGYLERERDPADRRRVKIALTRRGHLAGQAGRAAIQQIDRALQDRVGAQAIAHTRTTLLALVEIKRTALAGGRPEAA